MVDEVMEFNKQKEFHKENTFSKEKLNKLVEREEKLW
jgi:hypothetical protein